MHATDRACPSCGSTRLRAFSALASDMPAATRVDLIECTACVFAWQYPPARDFSTSVTHSEGRYDNRADHAYYAPAQRRRVALVELGFIETLVDPPGTLLDIGAGDGAFVRAAASRGWQATGIDPAAPRDGGDDVELIRGTLDVLPAERRFDVVTLFDVIEHLERPADVLTAAWAHVRPGGMLVIETGNYQSGERIAAGDGWWAYAFDHRWYFSPPAVERLLHDLGATDTQLAPRVLRPDWTGGPTYRPWLGGHLRRTLAHPWTGVAELRAWRTLASAARRWPAWSNLEIFTLAARRPA
ncbi:MAG: class I SAM-dependent methyltransferase [Gammaproteobacteria bacterium]